MAKQTSTGKKNSQRVARNPVGETPETEGVDIDALNLLKSDHEEVSAMFEEYEEASDSDKQDLAISICNALTVHAQIEEEIFYPAARQVLDEEDAELVNEADVEHGALKQLIVQIEALDGSDDHFDAMVKVLSEYVKHHVQEEENELFPRLEESELDVVGLGKRLAERKAELME
jgi:hemerythrin-like domain-containing protein